MTFNTDWLFKLATRKQERREKGHKPGAPPAPVRDKQDEGAALLRQAREKRASAFNAAMLEHPAFAAFMTRIAKYEPELVTPIRGVLDADLAELAVRLNVHELPPAIKFMVVEEVHALVQRVNKRCHSGRHWDEIPWCLPEGTMFTLQEVKEAIGVV